ncbi:PPC domain-containing DNA-binding protein [Desulfobacula sp.]
MGVRFAQGHLSNTVMIRIESGFDLIEEIENVCRKLEIESGMITCCIGSLQKAAYFLVAPLENRFGSGYGDPNILDGPLELLSGQGMIGKEENGEYFIHLHGLVSDKDRNVHGGHLIKGENPVLITCEIMVSQIQGMKIIRTYDPKVDMKVLMPFSQSKQTL